jgi:glutamyl-tRNA reductase
LTKGRKFAPIHALKDKLNAIKKSELIFFQSRKISDFNLEQAEIISARIIQKNNKMANHLKTISWWDES